MDFPVKVVDSGLGRVFLRFTGGTEVLAGCGSTAEMGSEEYWTVDGMQVSGLVRFRIKQELVDGSEYLSLEPSAEVDLQCVGTWKAANMLSPMKMLEELECVIMNALEAEPSLLLEAGVAEASENMNEQISLYDTAVDTVRELAEKVRAATMQWIASRRKLSGVRGV